MLEASIEGVKRGVMLTAMLATAAALVGAAQAADYAADYVIVGGGTAGCAVAARLCEGLPQAQVVLLERGAPRNESQELAVRALRLYGVSHADPEVTEIFLSEANGGLEGRPVPVITGRTLGGTSAINGAQMSRPEAKVPVSWGLRGLDSEARVEELYATVYDQLQAGPQPDALKPTYLKELLGAAELGSSKLVTSSKGEDKDVVFEAFMAGDDGGRRFDSAYAFLRPVVNGTCGGNLRVIEGATVKKVLLEGSVATGVEYEVDNVTDTVTASHEVILSAGAYASPKILMLSGIGPKATLEEFGVPMVADLPVGERAHPRAGSASLFAYGGNPPPPEALLENLNSPESVAQFAAGKGGVLSKAALPINGIYGPPIGAWRIDTMTAAPGFPAEENMGLTGCLLNTDKRSRATVRLNSTDIHMPPAVDLNLLAHPQEVDRMAECYARMRDTYGNLTAFGFNITEVVPGPVPLEEAVKTQVSNAQHFVGSCGIGRVLDEDLKVKGFQNLRVVDASAIPDMPENAGPAGTTYMLAEHIAAMIISDQGLGNGCEVHSGSYPCADGSYGV